MFGLFGGKKRKARPKKGTKAAARAKAKRAPRKANGQFKKKR